MFFAVGEGASEWNVWRYDLVTQGVFRHHATAQTAIDGLVNFDGVLAWCEGTTVVTEDTDNYVAEGYLITPNITFGLNTDINWTAFSLEASGLTSGAQILFYYSDDDAAILDPNHASWVLVQSFIEDEQTGIDIPVINTTSAHLALLIKVYPSADFATSPSVTRFAVRGLPKHRDWIVDVPINISDMVEAPGRMPLRVPGLGNTVHSRLMLLQGASATMELLDPPLTVRGVVDTIFEPTAYVTNRGSQGRRCMVRFLGSLVTTSDDGGVQGFQGLGIGGLGIATLGIGEST
jgi:hypothetical protein